VTRGRGRKSRFLRAVIELPLTGKHFWPEIDCTIFLQESLKGLLINDVTPKMGFLDPSHKILIQIFFFCMEVSHSNRPTSPKSWTSLMNDPKDLF